MIPTNPHPRSILNRTPDQRPPAPTLDHPQPVAEESYFPQELIDKMLQCKDPISLEPSDQEEIREFCSTHLPFLKLLVPCFANIGAKLELRKGTMHAVGKPFWQKTLSTKIDPQLLTPLWNRFCAERPQFEIWITLSDELILKRLQALVIYFVQSHLPATHKLALAEFGRVLDFVLPTEADQIESLSENDKRLYQLKQTINGFMGHWKSFTLPMRMKPCVQIELGPFKFIFGLPPSPDHFNLQLLLDKETLTFELKSPRFAWDALLSQLLHPRSSEQLWGKYWADLTLQGSNSQRPESKKAVIGDAFNAGMEYLPPGEALVVFHCNAVSCLGPAKTLPFPDLMRGTLLSPMGCFLYFYHQAPVRHVLYLMGSLIPECRKPNSVVEICWIYGDLPLHLVLPFKLEDAMGQIEVWLKSDHEACLSCMADAIRLLSPSILELPFSQSTSHVKLDDLYTHLLSDDRFFDAAIRFYFLLHASGYKTMQACDAIDLPHFIAYGIRTNQLEAVLKNLGQIYFKMPFFKAMLAQMQESTPDQYRQICVEQLLTCGEREIVSLAWSGFPEAQQLPFLQRVASKLDNQAFECALERICRHDFSKESSEGVGVLTFYLIRLLQKGGRLTDIYREKLVQKVLAVDRSLWFNLDVKVLDALPSPEASLMESLRSTMGTDSGIWWKNFLMVRKFIQRKDQKFRHELAAVFRDAVLHSDLSSQEGYAEVHKSLMVPKLLEGTDYAPLLTYEDPTTLAWAWPISKQVQTLSFLLEKASQFGPHALHYAVERVRGFSPVSEKFQLLCVYCALPAVEASDLSSMRTALKSLLDGNRELRLDLLSHPGVMDLSAEDLIEGLRTAVKKLEPAVWWGHFLSVQKFLQEKGDYEAARSSLAAVFQTAQRRYDLTTQEGSVEVYQTLAGEITDAPTRSAFQYASFISQDRCEESDVLQLPDFIAYAAEKKQVESALEKLGLVYQNSRFASLFTQIRSKVLEASTVDGCSPDALRGACVRELLICEEPKILESVWASSKKEQTRSFLLEIAPLLGPHALPFAVKRVCDLCTSTPQETVHLISVYLSRAPSEPRLRDLLTARLKTNPLLSLDPSVPVNDQCRVDGLEACIGKLDPQVWWGHFLAFRKTPGIDTVFQKALRRIPQLKDQEQFGEVYDLVAQRLFEERNEAGLLDFLKLTSSEATHPWFHKLIARCLDEKSGVSKAMVAALIGARAHQNMERTVLMNLVACLIEQKKAAKEVQVLCSTAVLQATEIPAVLDYFIAQGSNGCLMDQMIHSFSYFTDVKDRLAPVLEACVSRFEKMERNDPLWNKFAELLALMEKSEVFLEDSLKILERLASNPPPNCFKLPFPVDRLSDEQKFRLAKCYEMALRSLTNDAVKGEIIKAVTAVWLQEQLRKEESWEQFARLFLYLHRNKIDSKNGKLFEDAFWIAPHLLDHPDPLLVQGFERFLGRVPKTHLDTDQWRPLITRFVDRNPAMIEQVDAHNRSFFANCRTEAPQAEAPKKFAAAVPRRQRSIASRALETAIVIKSPADVREQIKKLLSLRPMTFETLHTVLNHLDMLPEEYELWQSFFEELSKVKNIEQNLGTALLGQGWYVWHKNHPVLQFKPEHGMYWCKAVEHLLCTTTATNYLGAAFLIQCSLMLLKKMEADSCKLMAKRFFEMGILYASDRSINGSNEIITVLFNINESPLLNGKIGSPQDLLSHEFKARLFLLFARHSDTAIQQAGENKFTACITVSELPASMGSEENKILFLAYAGRPFIPRNLNLHEGYLNWLEKSWAFFRYDLEWGAACNVVQAVLHYQCGQNSKAHLQRVHNIWETLVLGSVLKKWGDSAQTEEQPLFPEFPMLLMDRIIIEGPSLSEKAKLLEFLRERFNHYLTVFPVEARSRFRLRFCTYALSLFPFETPETCEAVRLCFEDLGACLSEMMTREGSDSALKVKEQQSCIVAFVNALPDLFNIAGTDLHPKIAEAIHQMMGILWIVNAEVKNDFCWFNVLRALTDSIGYVESSKQHAVALVARDVFIDCTHLDRVQQRKGTVPSQLLLDRSQVCLGSLFMVRTDIHCLSSDEWREVLHGLPLPHLTKIITGLMRVQNNDPAHCLNSMGAARLFRYTNINDELLIDLCIAAVGQYIPRFSEEFEDALQIECRAHWIMAMSDLAKRYQQLPDAFFELKNTLIEEFMALSISGISNAEQCQFVVKLFKEVIQDDRDVAEAIFTAFEIPEDLSHDLQAQLEELQNDIQARLKSKHG